MTNSPDKSPSAMETELSDLVLELPAIYDDPDEISEKLFLEKSEVAHRLTNFTRKEYLAYVEKLLMQNYATWQDSDAAKSCELQIDPKEIRKCAEQIELKAVQSCMIVGIYRKSILRAISEIRRETSQKLLNAKLIQQKFATKTTKDAHTQTSYKPKKRPKNRRDDVTSSSLDEKIRRFEETMLKKHHEEKKQPFVPPFPQHPILPLQALSPSAVYTPAATPATPGHDGTCFLTPASTCTTLSVGSVHQQCPEDDKIMKELQELFGDDRNEDLSDIFEESHNPLIDQIVAKEIEQFAASTAESATVAAPAPKKPDRSPSPRLKMQKTDKDNEKANRERLKNSIWPCELHRERLQLRELLSEVADRNYRRYELIKERFVDLFGSDSENELCPYSPSIELDEILLSSCRKRIASWVVKALMRPLNEGLIANRYLFKKLAKNIADSIIYRDQYPSEKFVKKFVEDYFCNHRAITCSEDINL